MIDLLKTDDLKEIDVEHLNQQSSGPVFITFSAWHPNGEEKYFGLNYFLRNNIHAILIRHKYKSLWWHTNEIFELFSRIRKYTHSLGLNVILYGSSMGGYGVVHFRDLLCADISISIAPQIFLDKKKYGFESRWSSDIDAIQDNFLIDELTMCNSRRPLYIFWDPLHELDNKHISLYKSNDHDTSVNFIEVPHSNHDTARLLHSSKMLEKILTQAYSKLLIEQDVLENSSRAFYNDPKCFFNFFRRSNVAKNQKYEFELFTKYASEASNLDFEALYMLAECYKLIDNLELAVKFMALSIDEYQNKYKKPAPEYLLLKNKSILNHKISMANRDVI
jgi:hypothetical protein